MPKQAKSLLFLSLLFLVVQSNAQIDLSYQYNVKAEVTCTWSQAATEDSLMVWARVTIPQLETKDFYMSYQLADDPIGRSIFYTDSILPSQLVSSGHRNHLMSFNLTSKSDKAKWIFIYFKAKKSGKQLVFFRSLEPANGGLYLQDAASVPMATRFVRQGEVFSVKTLRPADSVIWIYYYAQDFPQADIPMESTPVENKMKLDSLFQIKTNQIFQAQKEGLYLIKTDTSAKSGLSFIMKDPYYPRHAQIDDVINSLVYITTTNEYQILTSSLEKKKTLDRFWLNLFKTPERAKPTIKRYYEKVEEANLLFANYKEGWKTDQGLIYIIYGAPLEVYSYGNKEEWIYQVPEDNSRISFTFVEVNTIFGGSFYALIREKRHSRHWHKALELWRIGRK